MDSEVLCLGFYALSIPAQRFDNLRDSGTNPK
jgi:hypothetical protein